MEERKYNCNVEAEQKPEDLNLDWKYHYKLLGYFILENVNTDLDIYTT